MLLGLLGCVRSPLLLQGLKSFLLLLSWGLGEEQAPPWDLLLPGDAQRVGPCLGRGGKAVGEKHQAGEIRVQLLSCALRKVDC